ncbi:Utp13 domain-containing protein [Psidium guajava]|nr:Utp13 domain-containing protein [Psidium guajava]
MLMQEEGVLKGQELENAVSDADYTKAIELALELRRPHKLFELFSELCRTQEVGDRVERILSALSSEEVRLLLEYVREWNTKPKLCHVAQSVLLQVFKILSPTEIAEIKGIGELLEGLIPYSQRHFSRMDRLVRSTYLLDYTLTGMSVIEPEVDRSAVDDGSPVNSGLEKLEYGLLGEIAGEEKNQNEELERSTSKKRKLPRFKDRSKKKSKNVTAADAAAISLRA